MPLSEQDYIDLVITEIGGDTEDGLLATQLPIYWELHADLASDAARMAAIKIDGLTLLLGQTWRKVSFKALDGASVQLSDMFDHLSALLDLARTAAGQLSSGAGGGVAIGTLTKTAPLMPDTPRGLDPNGRQYRGDPLRRPGDGRP